MKPSGRNNPDQVPQMVPVLRERVPAGDLAHFVSDLVETGPLDLSAIYASYAEERGYPPNDPRLMVKPLVNGYANGAMSSRRVEAGPVAMWRVPMLRADQHPDYHPIARPHQALSELLV
jgi:hypothetical protein